MTAKPNRHGSASLPFSTLVMNSDEALRNWSRIPSATRSPEIFWNSCGPRRSARKWRGKFEARIRFSVWVVILSSCRASAPLANLNHGRRSACHTIRNESQLGIGNRAASALEVRPLMSQPARATVPSTRNQREKTVPVVTVESFYDSHAEKLQMKLEGPRVGFHRKIREPTIN